MQFWIPNHNMLEFFTKFRTPLRQFVISKTHRYTKMGIYLKEHGENIRRGDGHGDCGRVRGRRRRRFAFKSLVGNRGIILNCPGLFQAAWPGQGLKRRMREGGGGESGGRKRKGRAGNWGWIRKWKARNWVKGGEGGDWSHFLCLGILRFLSCLSTHAHLIYRFYIHEWNRTAHVLPPSGFSTISSFISDFPHYLFSSYNFPSTLVYNCLI